MIRPGLCSVTFRALDPEAVVDLAVDTGVEAIEWGADKHVPPGNPDHARRIGALCRAQGIVPASYGSYARAGSVDAVRDFHAVVETARALGAGNIRVWAGAAKRSEAGEVALAQAAADLHAMAEMAAKCEITISVEYHRQSLTEEAPDTLALLVAADHANLFTYWQPVPGRGRARWLKELALLAPHLGDLHVFHWIMTEAGQQRRPLAEGAEDWRALFEAWQRSPRWPHPHTGFLEFVRGDGEDQFRADMAHLRALCRQPIEAT